jgi:hypothetical protein
LALQGLWGRLLGRQQQRPEEAFLADLAELKRTWDAERTAAWASGRKGDPLGALVNAAEKGHQPPDWAEQWLEQHRETLLARYPEADDLVFRWLCDGRERKARVRSLGQQGLGYGLDPVLFLLQWCLRHPAPAQAEAVERAVREALEGLNHQVSGHDRVVAEGLLRLLVGLGALERAGALLMEAVQALAAARAEGGAGAREKALGELIGSICLQPVLEAGILSADQADLLLREFPHFAGELQGGGQGHVITRYIERAAAGDSDPQVLEVLLSHPQYHGAHAFLAACRALERHPGVRLPAGGAAPPDHPLAWAIHLLRHMADPAPADAAGTGEFATLHTETLIRAALLAPGWAGLLEPHLDWPGLQAVVLWLQSWSGPADPNSEEIIPVDRQGALAAVAPMDARLERLLNHAAARALYRDGLLCLGAILGRNAEAVEAGFLSRSLPSVRALGLMPDKGDVFGRYMALRRFIRECRRSRGEADRRAGEHGLANLAVTAGYSSVNRLEWAMERQLTDEPGPARRWSIGPYSVRLETTEGAGLIVERNGRRVRAVPVAVKKAAVYGEIKAAQEGVRALWWRIRRRLEQAMACEEVVDRETFLATFRTAPGSAMIPRLVLRVWQAGEERPVEVLSFRTLDGRAIALEQVEQLQVAHPLHLAEAGSLQAWQEHLVETGDSQPFNQLFREIYLRSPAESPAVHRLAGHKAKAAALLEQLRRMGWRRASGEALVRRFSLTGPEPVRIALCGAPESDTLTLGAMEAPTGLPAVLFSEALRELERAAFEAAPDPACQPVSPEVVAMRAALLRLLIPSARLEADAAVVDDLRVDLRTGTVLRPDRDGVAAPQPAPLEPTVALPFPDADPDTIAIVSRLAHVTRVPL